MFWGKKGKLVGLINFRNTFVFDVKVFRISLHVLVLELNSKREPYVSHAKLSLLSLLIFITYLFGLGIM